MRRKNIVEWAMILCWVVLIFFFISIITRFLARQILVEKFHWNNTFTHIIEKDGASVCDIATVWEEKRHKDYIADYDLDVKHENNE